MRIFVRLVSWLFGSLLLALAVFVSIETISRKLFNFSFQGADELGGYVLAVGSSLAFTAALIERGHIRIDLIHDHLPKRAKAWLNWLAVLSLALLGLFFAIYCYPVIIDTLAYRSTAATPWATPLIYPQAVWYAGLLTFTLATLIAAARASWLFWRGHHAQLDQEFDPKGALDELKEELADLGQR